MRRFREIKEVKEAHEKLPNWYGANGIMGSLPPDNGKSIYYEVDSLPEQIEISIDEEIQKEVDSLPEQI